MVNGKFLHFLFLFSLVIISQRFSFLKKISLLFAMWIHRLVDVASHYYDLSNFPNCEAKRVIEKLYKKREREKEESKKNRK